jgi:uncharacterized protein YyaL (SSP411 family)
MNLALIPWLPWSTDAFQRAHASGRPVLLSIVARWSAACEAMETEVFAQPAVVAAVAAHAVPVRVDADQRPDIADRYGLGGWPTTVWLTPDGEMLSGGTYIDADTLTSALPDVATRFQRDRAALVRQSAAVRAQRRQALGTAVAAAPAFPIAAGDGAADAADHADRPNDDEAAARAQALEAIRDCILQEFDPEHGGFGQGAKFPLAAPILFALRAGVLTADPDLIVVVETTLDRIAESALSDPRDGAFHRACANRDWTDPDPARLLDVHADMIALYLEAWRLLHHDRYRTRALAALHYVDKTLREHGEHGKRSDRGERKGGADGGAFYHSEPLALARNDDPAADPLIVTDSNARMMRALVHASQTLDDTRWILAAVAVAERLLPIVYVRGSGVAHCLRHSTRDGPDPRERPHVFGLLADAIGMASALLDLGEAAGQHVYVELAEELTRSCVRRFWDAGEGGFIDRIRTTAGAGDVGLLGEPLKPFAANVEAARLLARLAERTQDPLLASRAREARRYLAAAAPREGILSSEYGLLLLDLGRTAAV